MPILHVVTFDPSRLLAEGSVISNAARLAGAHAKGVSTLPVDSDLLPGPSIDPSDGYSIRHWGDGWAFDRGAGERGCPMLLRVLPLRPYVHWQAMLAPIEESMHGQIRLVTNSSNPVYASSGLSPLVTPTVMASGSKGTMIVGGLAQVSVSSECLLALNLHAVAKGVRVLWSAVSHASGKQ